MRLEWRRSEIIPGTAWIGVRVLTKSAMGMQSLELVRAFRKICGKRRLCCCPVLPANGTETDRVPLKQNQVLHPPATVNLTINSLYV